MDFSNIVSTAESLKQQAEQLIDPSMFSTSSIEGWICILLVGFIIWNIGRKALKFIGWSIGAIVLFQILHYLSMTPVNDIIPLSQWFKFDVMTSIAQCFAGTAVCDIILTVNSWIRAIILELGRVLTSGEIRSAIESMVW